MKFSLMFLAAGLVAAQDFSGQPTCIIPCLKKAIPKAGCEFTDLACLCKEKKKEEIKGLVAPCALGKCSLGDIGQAKKAAEKACKGVNP